MREGSSALTRRGVRIESTEAEATGTGTGGNGCEQHDRRPGWAPTSSKDLHLEEAEGPVTRHAASSDEHARKPAPVRDR
jgi:hypothetical protein